MPFDVLDIINEAKSGTKPSLFWASIKFPTISAALQTGKINSIGAGLASRFLIKATTLPASTLGIVEVPFMGRKIKLAGDRTFEDWETTLINDEDFKVRDAIEKWSNGINGLRTNRPGFATSLEYRSSAEVTQLSASGVSLRTYNFHNIWPSVVSSMEVNWETTDAISEYTVTWTYDYYTFKSDPASGLGGIADDVATTIRNALSAFAST